MEEMLEAATESFTEENITFITKETAEEYQSKFGGKASGVVSFHVDNCSINDEKIFERSDPRVSKETLQCKVYFNTTKYEFAVDHHLEHSSERQRIRFDFNHVMGMSISGQSFTFDICQCPHFEVKTKITLENDRHVFSSKWDPNTNFLHLSTLNVSKYRVAISCHEAVEKNLVQRCFDVPVLARALERSLMESYPDFTPFSQEEPHERMPLLKDPTLVRAAQLAILDVAEDPRSKEDVLFVVRMFRAIEREFRQKLKDRLNPSPKPHEE